MVIKLARIRFHQINLSQWRAPRKRGDGQHEWEPLIFAQSWQSQMCCACDRPLTAAKTGYKHVACWWAAVFEVTWTVQPKNTYFPAHLLC